MRSIPFLSSLASVSLPAIDWKWKALAAAALAPVALRLAYLSFFRANQLQSPCFYDNKSEKFKLIRRRAYPPGFPRGWYNVASLHELSNGK